MKINQTKTTRWKIQKTLWKLSLNQKKRYLKFRVEFDTKIILQLNRNPINLIWIHRKYLLVGYIVVVVVYCSFCSFAVAAELNCGSIWWADLDTRIFINWDQFDGVFWEEKLFDFFFRIIIFIETKMSLKSFHSWQPMI